MAALFSHVLGFLSWSYWLTAPLFIGLLFLLCGMVLRKGGAFLVALLVGVTTAALMPNVNHA